TIEVFCLHAQGMTSHRPESRSASLGGIRPGNMRAQGRATTGRRTTPTTEMTALRRVQDELAGPGAVGILLPPGARTVLIVRPRTLAWDLLLMESVAGNAFRELTREEAPGVVQAFLVDWETWTCGGPGCVQAVASSNGEGAIVWIDIGDFTLAACARVPGQPYEPARFPTTSEADEAARKLPAVLHPENGEPEVYINTRHFAR